MNYSLLYSKYYCNSYFILYEIKQKLKHLLTISERDNLQFSPSPGDNPKKKVSVVKLIFQIKRLSLRKFK